MGSRFSRRGGDVLVELGRPADEDVERHLAEDVAPYSPSWVDRLTDWVRRLPVPGWLFYLALGLGLTLLLVALAWAAGARELLTVIPYYFLEGMTVAYLLALVHFLDNSAAAALRRFRPVLTVDDAGYHWLCYRLTTLPARPTLIASGLGAAYTLVALPANLITASDLVAVVAPRVTMVVAVGFNFLIYTIAGVLVYHTLHQLSTVNMIYTRYTRINLFQLGPLYALSGLTARTAIGIAIPTYVWFQVNTLSVRGTVASDIIQTVFLGIMIVVTFVWPLLGAHGLLERERQRLQDEVARRIEATIAALHGDIDAGEVAKRGTLTETLEGLATEQAIINKLPTWPWRTETVSTLVLTFLLPILLWIVQRVLERMGL